MTNPTYESGTFEEACATADAARAKANNQGNKNKNKERIVDRLIKIAINQSAGDHLDAGGLFHAPRIRPPSASRPVPAAPPPPPPTDDEIPW
jgi:hypothetical protein